MSDARNIAKASFASIRFAIGQRLRSAREKLGESQTKFAERMGVTKLTVLIYEAGTSCPGADHLFKLASADIDASFIAFGVPSLATPESRGQFASALAWVRRECAPASQEVSDAALVEAAWVVFSALRTKPTGHIPADDELRRRAQAAIECLQGGIDFVR